jgi:hypothetical protein
MKAILQEEDAAFLVVLIVGGVMSPKLGLLVLAAWVCYRICGLFDDVG